VRSNAFLHDVFKNLGFELTDAAVNYWTSAFIKRYHLSMIRKGVEPTLNALSKKYSLLCVTSRETLAEVMQELKFLHIDGLFNSVVTRDVAAKHFGLNSLPFFPFHEQRKKLYECALEIIKCSPKSAVAIGDMERELKPAKELSITTVGLVTYQARKNELARASDFLISNITQLQKVLLKLRNPRVS
jgi:phosphoglycolate phosphatase-like HAD superfamily hydrolase